VRVQKKIFKRKILKFGVSLQTENY
jgi:hypothetical protein